MTQAHYKHLFEPIKVGKTLFQNRLFASPQDYPGVSDDKYLTEQAAYFYERKALGGFATVCVGDMIIDAECGRSHPFQLRGNDFQGKVGFTRTATAIKRHGSIASIELCHAGRNANPLLMPEGKRFVYGPTAARRYDGVEILEMNEEQIEALIGQYADAAAFAKQCGFQLMHLHGGHGWQIAQFMSPRENKRKDRWGGSIENRMRFPLAVVEAVRKRIGPNYPIEFRISVEEYLPGGYALDEGIYMSKMLDGKVDIINASVGHHEYDEASMITMPSMFHANGANIKYAEALKKNIKTPVSAVGALNDPEMLEEVIASGKADFLELGRESLADPDFAIKARLGKRDEITPCLKCFNCFAASAIGGVFYCAANPEIGREQAEQEHYITKKKKKVLVAGGGVGGMEAALTAAKEGHEVILCEKTDRLGGILRCEEQIPFKQNLDLYLNRQAKKVENAPIDLRLNTEVTENLLEELQPEVILAALGARPVKPKIDGIDSSIVKGAEEIYYHPEKAGDTVVILGGGLVGLELGLYLADLDKTVTVVEMAPMTIASPPPVEGTSNRMSGIMEISLDYPLVHGVAIKEEIKKYPKMKVMVSTKALSIDEKGILLESQEGRNHLDVDTVIYAVGQKPLTDTAMKLAVLAPEFHAIGDCLESKNIYSATSVAHQVALDIGRL